MQGSLLIRAVLLTVSMAMMLSCATKKTTLSNGKETEISRAERLQVVRQVDAHQLRFTTFSGRAKSKMVINQDQYDVTANVRIEYDQAIWISVTALMGIEAARVLITPDSIKMINRLKGEYLQEPFEYLYQFTTDKLDFNSLQQLLVGNVVQQTLTRDTQIWKNGRGYSVQGNLGSYDYTVQLDSAYRPMRTTWEDVRQNELIEASYADYQHAAGQRFPNQMGISVAAPGLKIQAEMRFSRIVYDEILDMPFRIPDRYKAIQ